MIPLQPYLMTTEYFIYQHGVSPDAYESQLNAKASKLIESFSRFNAPDLEVYPSAPSHFRLRAEFRLWHSGDRCFYAMFDSVDKKKVLEVKDFPVASQLINRLMTELLEELQGNELLSKRLFQVEDRKSTRLNSSHVRISYAVF